MKKVIICFILLLAYLSYSSDLTTDINKNLNNINDSIKEIKNEIKKNKNDAINQVFEFIIKDLLPISAFIISIFVILYTRKTENYKNFLAIINEYSNKNYYEIVSDVWGLYYQACHQVTGKREIVYDKKINEKIKIKINENFKELSNDLKNTQLQKERRELSNFYFKIWMSLKAGFINKKQILEFFDKETLNVIDYVIIPIETALIEIKFNKLDKDMISKLINNKIKPWRNLFNRLTNPWIIYKFLKK